MKKFRFQPVAFPGPAGTPDPETEVSGLTTKKLKGNGKYVVPPISAMCGERLPTYIPPDLRPTRRR